MLKLQNHSGAEQTIVTHTNESKNAELKELCKLLNNIAATTAGDTDILLSEEYSESQKLKLLKAMEKVARATATAVHAYIHYSTKSSKL